MRPLTQPLPRECREAMIVDLIQIKLLHNGGGRSEVLAGVDTISACGVSHTRHILRLPQVYGDCIILSMGGVRLNASGATGKFYYRSTLITPSSATSEGSLSVTINDELTVAFTNDQLMFGEPYIEGESLVQQNVSQTSTPINILPRDDNQTMLQLGGAAKLDDAKACWH
ncbi:hypothetical protein SVAN01_07635 [Stagonosporopsis vannaccii]|nr:hypothetical protein SVAN01_07635 [Stagonosporopsis vannaccii]